MTTAVTVSAGPVASAVMQAGIFLSGLCLVLRALGVVHFDWWVCALPYLVLGLLSYAGCIVAGKVSIHR